MSRRLRAFRFLVNALLLRQIWRSRLRSVVTLVGVASAVAVPIAIHTANSASLAAFRVASESIAGKASLQIVSAAGRFDEALLADLAWIRQFGRLSPMLEGRATFSPTQAPAPERLQVLAVDILRDHDIRQYDLVRFSDAAAPSSGRELIRLLGEDRAIILTQTFCDRHAIDVGDEISLRFDGVEGRYVVRGVLRPTGLAGTLGDNFVLMDIAAGQLALRRIGEVDRVDLRLAEDISVESAMSAIEQRLPSSLFVRTPSGRIEQVERMIAAFHFNLNALGSLAVVVGLFLLYDGLSTSVRRRRREIGLLATVGVTPRQSTVLVLSEAVLFALVGSLAGVPFGTYLADWTVQATSTTVETFYVAQAATDVIKTSNVSAVTAAVAVFAAVVLAVLSGWRPARQAAQVQPVEAMRPAPPSRRMPKLSAAPIVCAALAVVCSLLPASNGLPVAGYFAAIFCLLCGGFLVAPALRVVAHSVEQLVANGRRGLLMLRLASAQVNASAAQLSLASASLAVSAAMLVAIAIMVGSFRDTVMYWTDQTLQADLFLKPTSLETVTQDAALLPDVVKALSEDDDVQALDRSKLVELEYAGQLTSLAVRDLGVVVTHGGLSFKSPPRSPPDAEDVFISESFALRFGKRNGDAITLRTRHGPRELRIAAVFFDYSNHRGTVLMDYKTYQKLFEAENAPVRVRSLALYLKPEVSPDLARARIASLLSPIQDVTIAKQEGIRREVRRIFDSTFLITYALEIIAMFIAALALVSALTTSVLDRRIELSRLTAIGTTARQRTAIIACEGALVTLSSLLIGAVTGFFLSLILVYVINVQSFHWTIQFRLPWTFLLQATTCVAIAALLAGLYSGRMSARRRLAAASKWQIDED